MDATWSFAVLVTVLELVVMFINVTYGGVIKQLKIGNRNFGSVKSSGDLCWCLASGAEWSKREEVS